ncbi:hypothetical protein BJ742DRAFT_841485 [Cladochytrium replicatum]|nr:hypothetical protein BJ742DRAFT_841485 [Cladochytrium replicatum]
MNPNGQHPQQAQFIAAPRMPQYAPVRAHYFQPQPVIYYRPPAQPGAPLYAYPQPGPGMVLARPGSMPQMYQSIPAGSPQGMPFAPFTYPQHVYPQPYNQVPIASPYRHPSPLHAHEGSQYGSLNRPRSVTASPPPPPFSFKDTPFAKDLEGLLKHIVKMASQPPPPETNPLPSGSVSVRSGSARFVLPTSFGSRLDPPPSQTVDMSFFALNDMLHAHPRALLTFALVSIRPTTDDAILFSRMQLSDFVQNTADAACSSFVEISRDAPIAWPETPPAPSSPSFTHPTTALDVYGASRVLRIDENVTQYLTFAALRGSSKALPVLAVYSSTSLVPYSHMYMRVLGSIKYAQWSEESVDNNSSSNLSSAGLTVDGVGIPRRASPDIASLSGSQGPFLQPSPPVRRTSRASQHQPIPPRRHIPPAMLPHVAVPNAMLDTHHASPTMHSPSANSVHSDFNVLARSPMTPPSALGGTSFEADIRNSRASLASMNLGTDNVKDLLASLTPDHLPELMSWDTYALQTVLNDIGRGPTPAPTSVSTVPAGEIECGFFRFPVDASWHRFVIQHQFASNGLSVVAPTSTSSAVFVFLPPRPRDAGTTLEIWLKDFVAVAHEGWQLMVTPAAGEILQGDGGGVRRMLQQRFVLRKGPREGRPQHRVYWVLEVPNSVEEAGTPLVQVVVCVNTDLIHTTANVTAFNEVLKGAKEIDLKEVDRRSLTRPKPGEVRREDSLEVEEADPSGSKSVSPPLDVPGLSFASTNKVGEVGKVGRYIGTMRYPDRLDGVYIGLGVGARGLVSEDATENPFVVVVMIVTNDGHVLEGSVPEQGELSRFFVTARDPKSNGAGRASAEPSRAGWKGVLGGPVNLGKYTMELGTYEADKMKVQWSESWQSGNGRRGSGATVVHTRNSSTANTTAIDEVSEIKVVDDDTLVVAASRYGLVHDLQLQRVSGFALQREQLDEILGDYNADLGKVSSTGDETLLGVRYVVPYQPSFSMLGGNGASTNSGELGTPGAVGGSGYILDGRYSSVNGSSGRFLQFWRDGRVVVFDPFVLNRFERRDQAQANSGRWRYRVWHYTLEITNAAGVNAEFSVVVVPVVGVGVSAGGEAVVVSEMIVDGHLYRRRH